MGRVRLIASSIWFPKRRARSRILGMSVLFRRGRGFRFRLPIVHLQFPVSDIRFFGVRCPLYPLSGSHVSGFGLRFPVWFLASDV